MLESTSTPRMTPGHAAMLALSGAYLDAGLDHEITTLEVQKLAYFVQLAGEELDLRFTQHHHGPYADALPEVLARLEGRYITRLGDDTAKPDFAFELRPGAAQRAREALADRPTTQRAVAKVIELIEGFEDSYGLELLATTHWVMQHDPPASEDLSTAVAKTHAGNPATSRMKPAHIESARLRLRERLR